MSEKRHILHLFSRRERWGLTWQGALLLLGLMILFIVLVLRNLYPLLAPTQREKADILVLEGFISDYVLQEAIQEFHRHPYQLLVTTGTPLEYGDLLAPYKNTATVAGKSLLKLGFDSTKLVIVSTEEIRNDRTYNSALALRQWLAAHKPNVKSLNLMTMGVHGARSRLLFKAAMGDSIAVGIISLKNFYYGPHSWWKSSKGFRETLNEAFGYFYVRFFFRPPVRNP